MHEHHRLRSWSYSLPQRMFIHMPAMVVEQGIRNQLHIIEFGKKFKQWIAWLRHKNFITRIAQQAKQERIGFAGTGSEDQRVPIDSFSAVEIVVSDRRACLRQAQRIGIVFE